MAKRAASSHAKEPTEEERQRSIERIYPESYATVYANSVDLKVSVYDFVLDFGMVTEATDEKLTVQQSIRVVMSPQHVKVFAPLLLEKLRQYEARWGELRIAQQESVDTEE